MSTVQTKDMDSRTSFGFRNEILEVESLHLLGDELAVGCWNRDLQEKLHIDLMSKLSYQSI